MLVLVSAITAVVFVVSFVQSRQMFLKQVASWIVIVPQQAMTNLIDSDHFSIEREVTFLQSTGLFSFFCIKDNQGRMIASFGSSACSDKDLIPIKDDASVVWGYYSYQSNFYKFILPFLVSGAMFLGLISMLYFLTRWRMRSNLEAEFSKFNQFLQNIELLTEKIHDVYQEESDTTINKAAVPHNTEQIIINRAIAKLLDEIKKANHSLRDAISRAEKKRFQDELTETALQVAHDLGSPLAVLGMTMQSASTLPEEARVAINNATARIRDISHFLLKKSKCNLVSASDEIMHPHLLCSLVSQVASDKRLEYRDAENIQIDFDYSASDYGLYSMIKAADFGRILSNLINNAIESFDGAGGNVVLKLIDVGSMVCVEVKDNGKGIPDDILQKLGKMGETHGKSDGHGLGLYHAKTTIASWNGTLTIQSKIGVGTTVSIFLQKSQLPAWFLSKIALADEQVVVIIDDDESIHSLWKNRFKHLMNGQVTLFHFYELDELARWVEVNREITGNVLYLCDYEFSGESQNGIDLINSLKINMLSILVTSKYYQDEIIEKCNASSIKLLPKDAASLIPIGSICTQ